MRTLAGGDATRVRTPGQEPGAPDACLVFVEGEAVLGLRVPLAAEAVLGRDADCTVPLPAEDVSRRHARVAPEGGGHVLADLGSTNGTFVNGVKVTQPRRLEPGDVIRVGETDLRYDQ